MGRFVNTFALLAALSFVFTTGCDKKTGDDAKPGAAAATGKAAAGKAGSAAAAAKAPAVFEYIPADSPYVFANTQAMPEAAMAKIWTALTPLLQKGEAELAKELARTEDKSKQAILKEFKGKLNRKGLESLGLSLSPKFALYGVGFMPVFRMTLKDSKAIKALVGRIETATGEKIPTSKHGTHEYWGMAKDGMEIVVSVENNELLVAITPTKVSAETLPIIFKDKKPAKSLAAAGTFKKIITKYGYQGFGTGYIDLKGVAKILMGDGAGLNAKVFAALDAPLPPLDGVCKAEIMGMVNMAPRMVFGYTSVDAKVWKGNYVIEMKSSLAKQLAALAAPVPGLGQGKAMMSFGMGLDLKKGVEFLKAQAANVKKAPFKCAMLKDLNEAFAGMEQGLNAPIPPFVFGIRGFNVVLKGGDFYGAMPKNVKAYALIAMDNPDQALAMAAGMVPPLAGLKVATDGKPVAFPAGLIPPGVVDAPFIAMNKKAIAFSVGQGEEKGLGAVLNAKADGTPLFAMAYDMKKLAELSAKTMSADEKMLLDAMSGILGQVAYSVHMTNNGIEIKSTIWMN